jgi:hypothetical protein
MGQLTYTGICPNGQAAPEALFVDVRQLRRGRQRIHLYRAAARIRCASEHSERERPRKTRRAGATAQHPAQSAHRRGRDTGMKRVDELVRDALLNPELARALLTKVPERPGPAFGSNLATALKRSSVAGMATAMRGGGSGRPRFCASANSLVILWPYALPRLKRVQIPEARPSSRVPTQRQRAYVAAAKPQLYERLHRADS